MDFQRVIRLFKSGKNSETTDFPLLTELTPAEFELVISAAREERFFSGEIIFTEGDPVGHVVLLVSGFVKLKEKGINGNEVACGSNGAGDIVASCVCSKPDHRSTAQAIRACSVLVWDVGVFEKLLMDIPSFRRNNIRALKEHLRDMEQRFKALKRNSDRLMRDWKKTGLRQV